jgi:hypothetical protein
MNIFSVSLQMPKVKGGQFYTPQSIVKLLVRMLAPEAEKRFYDGCCGSGGMSRLLGFISQIFVESFLKTGMCFGET